MAHPGLPQSSSTVLYKSELLKSLVEIDSDPISRNRVLQLETAFREKIAVHLNSLPTQSAKFKKFNTNPFVLMMYCLQQAYGQISRIEHDILPAKLFSSMETSAGKMVENVTLPIYGWEIVESDMHSQNSALDGKCLTEDGIKLVTLKSGPRCLNDEMSENFADAILNHVVAWANDANVQTVDFTYGVLYGTRKQSNKKDWHILRNIKEKIPQHGGEMVLSPDRRWKCSFTLDEINTNVAIRIGTDWWAYLGDDRCLAELCTALIRACVKPGETDSDGHAYTISDLAEIVSTENVPSSFNVSILQRSQIAWLFFLARHFCDELWETNTARDRR